MRLVYGTTGALLVALGASAAITGDFVLHGSWLVAVGLAAFGCAGLLATASALAR